MKLYKDVDSVIEYASQPHLELCGNTRCTVDGLKKITEYSCDKIKMSLGKYSVAFFGDGLFINAFTKEGAIVEGTIISMEFESND